MESARWSSYKERAFNCGSEDERRLNEGFEAKDFISELTYVQGSRSHFRHENSMWVSKSWAFRKQQERHMTNTGWQRRGV